MKGSLVAGFPRWLLFLQIATTTVVVTAFVVVQHTPPNHRRHYPTSPNNCCWKTRTTTRTSPSLPPVAFVTMSSSLGSSTTTPTTESSVSIQTVGQEIGSGSYGTVHWLRVAKGNSQQPNQQQQQQLWCIGKRAWTLTELKQQQEQSDQDNNELPIPKQQQKQDFSKKAQRCLDNYTSEKECLEKLNNYNTNTDTVVSVHDHVTTLMGTALDEHQREWMLFPAILQDGTTTTTTSTIQQEPEQPIGPTLLELLEQDRMNQKTNGQHHLYCLAQGLGLSGPHEQHISSDSTDTTETEETSPTLAETIDVITTQLMEAIVACHEQDIVHRDVKPGNLIVSRDGKLRLIDFGSAADLANKNSKNNKSNWMSRLLLEPKETIVSVSPIYAAPELFVEDSPIPTALKFDCFSAGMLLCQLLFQYLDERTESGFHQQMAWQNNDLDRWLLAALQGKVQPKGLMDALQVLEERPGMWRLLQDLLRTDPEERISSHDALRNWRRILQQAQGNDENMDDPIFDNGAYLTEVLELAGLCAIPPTNWPLHYVATFDRKKPLGLYLAESSTTQETTDDNDDDDGMLSDPNVAVLWKQATQDATQGEVFVQGVVPLSQADEMGIFQVGDRLEGVGELPTAAGGFENVLELLQDQPRGSRYVTLHFNRKPVLNVETSELVIQEGSIQLQGQGAWSSKGRRTTQEDAYILNEIHDAKERSIILAGVMDGHLGRAASRFVQEELPVVFSEELLLAKSDIPTKDLLERAWERTVETYQNECISGDECVADYDPREGLLMANTGSQDAIAGTTAVIMALGKQSGQLTILNCGDSRAIVLDRNARVEFQTRDHTPEREVDRFVAGIQQGLKYKEPQCRMNRWTIVVGDYTYAVARSLEGPYATERGIIATADIDVLSAEPGSTIVLASDGMWEVMDSEQVAKIVAKFRWTQSMTGGDAAKALCSMAVEKGSSDNVSAVVVYIAE